MMTMIKASPSVHLFYREWLLDPERRDYHLVFDQSISGDLNLTYLKQALDYFLETHVLFRCHLAKSTAKKIEPESQDSEALYWQENQKTSTLKSLKSLKSLESYDLSELENLMETYLFSPFDLEKGPLYRFCVFSNKNKDKQEYRLFLIVHHVLLSGLFFKQFIQKISQIYTHIDSKAQLNTFAATGAEIEALSHLLEHKQDQLKQLQPDLFWAQALKHLPESNHLPYARSSRQRVVVSYFDIEINQLKNFSHYTTHNLLLLVWGVLMARYCHQEASYIAYPMAIKTQEEPCLLNYGAQINTLIMPIRLSGMKDFTRLYQETNDFIRQLKINSNLKYSDYPIDQILQAFFTQHQEKLKLNIGFAQTHLKNTKLEFLGCKAQINHEFDARDIGGYELLLEYDLESYLESSFKSSLENSGSIRFRLRARADLFQAWQLESLVNQYQALLRAVLKNPEAPVVAHELPFWISSLPWRERQDNRPCLLDREGGGENNSIISLFESYAKDPAYSDRLALISHQDDQSPRIFSYQELNQKSNQLARVIRKKYLNLTGQDLNFDALIPIIAERSLEMMIGILGILKAGGAYVPINPSYPKERIDFIIKDTGAALVLSQDDLNNYLNFSHESHTSHESCENLNLLIQPNHLAYVIYTSGTTGQPKGVMVEHHSVINLVKDSGYINISPQDVFVQLADPCFDAATFEIWGALLNGAVLLLPKPGLDFLSNTKLFKNYLIQNKVSILWLTKTLFDYFYQADPNLFANLTYLLIGGEALNAHLIQKLCSQDTRTRPTYCLNGYGPTEATTFSTIYNCYLNSPYASEHQIPIGKPFKNIQTYVLDMYLQEVPIGTIGDLYIGGAGLARGYLNQEKLTAEKFIRHPKLQTRLYKTGDLARFLLDGNLEFFGRKDAQVKIRGHRIELSEIELALMKNPRIKQAVVLARTQKTVNSEYLSLVAYCVFKNPGDASMNLQDDLSRDLAQYLPDYMIPSIFIPLNQIPVTLNGKVNLKLLPEPSLIKSISTDSHRSIDMKDTQLEKIEKDLARTWSEILGLSEDQRHQIQSTDHFFRLGGDSILSIQLSSALSYKGYVCQVRDIYKYPELGALAQYLNLNLSASENQKKIKTEEGVLEGPLGFLPIQTWFFDNINNQNFKNFNYFNQNFTVIIPEKITPEILENYLEHLVEQHDILRVTYSKSGDLYQAQYQAKMASPAINIINIQTVKNIKNAMREWQSNFDILASNALWTVVYLTGYQDGLARLFIAFHHLIIDSVSWRIFLEDLKTLCEDRVLLPKTSSYRQWAAAIHDYGTEILENSSGELTYWMEACAEIEKTGKIKKIKAVPFNKKIQKQQLAASQALTDQLLHQVHRAYETKINDILLLALGMALQDTFGGDTYGVTLEGHGREDLESHPDLDISRTLGWFTSIYPVKIELKNNLEQSIVKIRDTLKNMPLKGLGFGALKYHPQAPEMFKNFKMPEISFNYLGQLNSNKHDKAWTISAEQDYQVNQEAVHPDNQSPYLIDLVAWISDGQLFFKVSSSLAEDLIEKLATDFILSLEKIAAHCQKIPMTYMQRYFFQYACGDNQRFTVLFPLKFTGYLEIARLKQSVQKIVQIQDVFKLRYQKHEDLSWAPEMVHTDLCHWIQEPGPISLTHLVSTLEELARKINIQTGPVLIIYSCKLHEDNTEQIIVVSHHLYLDRTSFGIFKNQLNYFYQDLNNLNLKRKMPAVYSFLDWARDLNQFIFTPEDSKEIQELWGLDFKQKNNSDGFFIDQENVNNDRPENYGTMVFYLEQDFIQEAHEIRQILPLFNLLFLTLFITSHFLNKEKKQWIAIDNVFLGRDLQGKIAKESLENTMGWLATNLPVRLNINLENLRDENLNTKDFILNLNQQLLAYMKPGNDVLYAAAKNKELNLIGKSRALFNYYNRESDQADQAEREKSDGFIVSSIQSKIPAMVLEQVDYKFALTVSKHKTDIKFNLYFNRLNYTDQSMMDFIDTYKKTAEQLVKLMINTMTEA